MGDFEGKIGRFQYRLDGNENDRRFNEKKARILAALKSWVEEELKSNPQFNINIKNLTEYLKRNPDKFDGVRHYGSIMNYFDKDLNFLRGKLGLPLTKTGKQEEW